MVPHVRRVGGGRRRAAGRAAWRRTRVGHSCILHAAPRVVVVVADGNGENALCRFLPDDVLIQLAHHIARPHRKGAHERKPLVLVAV